MEVKAHEVNKEVGISDADFLLTELPEIPVDFVEQINEIGGYCGVYPNIRIVSGLDPEAVEFNADEWKPRYAFWEKQNVTYYVRNWANGEKEVFTEAQYKNINQANDCVDLPVVETLTKYIPIPRYFAELYHPPEFYGDEKTWEDSRYMYPDDVLNDSGSTIDLMGEFPHNGQYETWFCIEDAVFDDDGKLIETTFKELDESVVEFIRFKVEKITNSFASERHTRTQLDNKEKEKKKLEESRDRIRDILRSRQDRLTNTEKIIVPENIKR